MANYLDIIANHREQDSTGAASPQRAPVFYEAGRRKPTRKSKGLARGRKARST